MKRNFIKSICTNPRTNILPRKYVPLGRSIRQGFIDGISEENSPLLRNSYDSEHGVQDPYFAFCNDTLGRDKFERSVKFEKQREELKKSKTEPTSAPVTELTSAPVTEPKIEE